MSSFSFDWDLPYSSRREPVLAANMVATSQPLAAQAGLRMLLQGGNAVDAALAAAIALTVVEPTSNGLGSDAFAILWDGKNLHGLNASGRSPKAWNPERFAQHKTMPLLGWDSVTVPGAVSAWVELSQKFGRLDFAKLFEPALEYSERGFLLSPVTAASWEEQYANLAQMEDWTATFLPDSRVPKAGELVRFPDHASTLARISQTRGEAFYRGELAEKIVAHSQSQGGAMTRRDLEEHQADWVTPIAHSFCGVDLHEIPPNGQGLAALLMLGILEHTSWRDFAVDSPQSVHFQIEAMKLAFADAHRYISDPQNADEIGPDQLLAEDYLARRAKEIDPACAKTPVYGVPSRGGTVYLTAADASGMMVSFIQSNFMGFGSGVVVPKTGIALQNRGSGFTLEAGHPNRVGGGKRPFHTIIPGFVTKNGEPLMSFGVMGGAMQPQGHAQMMIRIFGHHQNPQAAADAPRWMVYDEGYLAVESGFDDTEMENLAMRGHRVRIVERPRFGGAQLIYKVEGGYLGASDWRKDGQAVGF